MASPHIPAVHMNTRFICTLNNGSAAARIYADYPNDHDTKDFHNSFKKVCDAYDPEYYPKFKAWCDEYFYLKHRKEMRGVGGIFFDYLDSGNWQKDFSFTKISAVIFRNLFGYRCPSQR